MTTENKNLLFKRQLEIKKTEWAKVRKEELKTDLERMKEEKKQNKFYCVLCFKKNKIFTEINRFRKKAVMGICENCEKKHYSNTVKQNVGGIGLYDIRK